MKWQIIFISALMAFVSCKKEKLDIEAPNPDPSPQGEFNTPKTKGSYWIYQWYKIDENGVETSLQKDSIYVYGDTTINNLNYTVYKGSWFGANPYNPRTERDSSGYIVNQHGKVQYSYINFIDTLRSSSGNPAWDWYLKMYDNVQVTVPAGSFTSVEARQYCYYKTGQPANNCGDDSFTIGKWYVDGIGKVKETTGYVSDFQDCKYREARLIDYYIAP